MKIYCEKSLSDFDFWSEAKHVAKYLTYGDLMNEREGE